MREVGSVVRGRRLDGALVLVMNRRGKPQLTRRVLFSEAVLA